MIPLWQLSAGQLVAGFRDRLFTPDDALKACLARTAAVNPKINAIATLDTHGAEQAAAASTARWHAGQPLGPLDGVPITVKDSLHVRGLPTHCGSQSLAGLIAPRDETPVARLRAAGVVIFGKTSVPEFAMHGYTANAVTGVTGNPWNPALTPGGSSGGAAALVAAGGCPLALAQDGGGSIRRPASHTNLVGFKPSRHRVPRAAGGMPKLYLDYEVLGPIARCVDDAALAMDIIGSRPIQPVPAQSARILYIPRFADHPVDPQIARLTDAAADRFEALGHRVERAGRFDLAEAVNELWTLLPQVGLSWLLEHPRELSQQPFEEARLGPAMQANAQAGRDASGRTLFGLLYEIERLRSEVDALFEDHDFLLTPAAAALPWPAAQTHPTRIDGREVGPRGHAVFTGFVNATGLPAIALPCGWSQPDASAPHGLPVGLQLVARQGSDDALFGPARAWEQAHPWLRFPELGA